MAAEGKKCILMKAGIAFREAVFIIWLDSQPLWSQGISKSHAVEVSKGRVIPLKNLSLQTSPSMSVMRIPEENSRGYGRGVYQHSKNCDKNSSLSCKSPGVT